MTTIATIIEIELPERGPELLVVQERAVVVEADPVCGADPALPSGEAVDDVRRERDADDQR